MKDKHYCIMGTRTSRDGVTDIQIDFEFEVNSGQDREDIIADLLIDSELICCSTCSEFEDNLTEDDNILTWENDCGEFTIIGDDKQSLMNMLQ